MSKSYTCTNCLWEGTAEEMDMEGDELLCPNCCAIFHPDDPSRGPWEETFPGSVNDEDIIEGFYDE